MSPRSRRQICTYVLLIHTPRLCSEPIFLEGTHGSQDPPSVIQCQPIVKKLREAVDAPAVVPETSLPIPDFEPVAPVPIEQPPPPASEEPVRDQQDEGLLGLDSVTLIYDPDTGIIHSAEADGEELFFDSEEGPYEDDGRGLDFAGQRREGDDEREIGRAHV